MSFIAGVSHTNFDILYHQINRIPDEGEEIFSKGFDLQLGGGVPATMINLSRLGIRSKFCTFLGQDIFSNYVKHQFDNHEIKYKNMYKGKGVPLTITTAMITQKDRAFVSYSDKFEVNEEVLEEIYLELKGAEIVDMQVGYLPVYQRLKKEGTILVFDVGWDDHMSLESYKEYLEIADYFTPNKKEALKITGTDTIEEAAKVLSIFFREVIIKMDSQGCLYIKNDKMILIPSLKNIINVDSTGAGDAFLSGFIYGLYYKYPTIDCIIFGNVTGGVCVEGIGCLSHYVNEEELLIRAKEIKIRMGKEIGTV